MMMHGLANVKNIFSDLVKFASTVKLVDNV